MVRSVIGENSRYCRMVLGWDDKGLLVCIEVEDDFWHFAQVFNEIKNGEIIDDKIYVSFFTHDVFDRKFNLFCR